MGDPPLLTAADQDLNLIPHRHRRQGRHPADIPIQILRQAVMMKQRPARQNLEHRQPAVMPGGHRKTAIPVLKTFDNPRPAKPAGQSVMGDVFDKKNPHRIDPHAAERTAA